jgi:DnaA family protein
MTQLTLAVALRDGASFANYFAGANREAVQAALGVSTHGEQFVYLWGAVDTGKTHLLHAACRECTKLGKPPAYLSLSHVPDISAELFEDLEQLALVCIDDIHIIAGQAAWEVTLLNLYNRLRDTGTRLMVTANAAPAELSIALPDLRSRLSTGLVLQLHSLDDEGKLAALRLRAQGQGLDLSEEVGRFLLQRYPRDMSGLFALLKRLDDASLTAQRKLTIPFVRGLIGKQSLPE